MINDPRLVIFDEPMSGLDPIGRREVRELLGRLKEDGKTIILSSHIVPDVEMIADAVGILREGHLVAVRDLTELNHGYSYTGNLALQGVRPDWLPARHQDRGEGRVRVQMESVDALRKLLNDCHAAGVSVVSLETHRSSLEELFMEINRDATVPGEVAR